MSQLMNNPNVLLVGGTGFLGKHLAEEYLKLNYNVTILSRNKISITTGKGRIRHLVYNLDKKVPWDEITVNIGIAYFLYSPNIPRTNPYSLSSDISKLSRIGQKFLDSCVKNKVKTICFPSSGGAVYGKSSSKILNENSPTNPISNYGMSKLIFEKMLIMYQHLHNIDFLIFRISNVYGPFQNLNKPQGVISHWLRNTIKGETIEIWGNGEVKRDYIYISDAVSAMVAATESSVRNEIFNIGYGVSYSLLDILEVFKKILTFKLDHVYKEFHNTDVQDASLDVKLLKTTFAWSPKINLEEGIKLTYNFLKDNYGK